MHGNCKPAATASREEGKTESLFPQTYIPTIPSAKEIIAIAVKMT